MSQFASANDKHGLDLSKAVEVLLYVTQRVPDMYRALKILYFADVDHLANYGRFIYGDKYAALPFGRVPTMAYDIIKTARGDGQCPEEVSARELFSVVANRIQPARHARTELLSGSETESLDTAIEKYGHLTFDQPKHESHREMSTAPISIGRLLTADDIAAELPESDALIDYLHNG